MDTSRVVALTRRQRWRVIIAPSSGPRRRCRGLAMTAARLLGVVAIENLLNLS
jgi:hypothetical protein